MDFNVILSVRARSVLSLIASRVSSSSLRLSTGNFSGGGAESPKDSFSSRMRENAAPRCSHEVLHSQQEKWRDSELSGGREIVTMVFPKLTLRRLVPQVTCSSMSMGYFPPLL